MQNIQNHNFGLRTVPFWAWLFNLVRFFCSIIASLLYANINLAYVADVYESKIRFLENELKERDAEINRLNKKAQDTTGIIAEIDKIMKQMAALLGQDSTNSGWPSSTDGIKNFGAALKKLSKTYNSLISLILPSPNTASSTNNTNAATTLVPAGAVPVREAAANSNRTGKKRPGGQPGHKGSSMNCAGMDPTEEIVHIPDKCRHCPNYNECKKNIQKKDRRMVYDVRIIIDAIAHYMGVITCPQTGDVLCGSFPANVTGRAQYGSGVWALCAILVEYGCVSIARTGEILRDAFFIPVSDGTVQNAITRGGQLAIPFIRYFRQHLLLSPCVSFDETGRHLYPSPELIAEKEKNSKKKAGKDEVGKKKYKSILMWIHTATNGKYTVLHSSLYRGARGMVEGGILQVYRGIAIHDSLAAYWQFVTCAHGICLVHLQRDVNRLKELDPTQSGWLDRLMNLLYHLEDLKEEAIEACTTLKDAGAIPNDEMPHASDACIQMARNEFQKIIQEGRAMNPQPYVNPDKKGRGRKKKTEFANLLDRLEDHPDDWIRFFLDFRAWGNNTVAERSFRNEKISESVSKMIRSFNGSKDQSRLKSIIATAINFRIPPIKAFFQMYEGCTPDEVFHDPLPSYAPYYDPFEPYSFYFTWPAALPAAGQSSASVQSTTI